MVLSWLRRVFDRSRAARRWAPPLTVAQRRRLEELVLAWFVARDRAPVLGEGFVSVDGTDYGLDNVAQRCRPLPPDEWPACVDQHFASFAASSDDAARWDADSRDFDRAAPFLRLRLYHPDYAAAGRDGMLLAREDLAETRSVLVADLPSCVVNVLPERVADWGKTRDEAFAVALAAVGEHCPVEWEAVELAGAVAHVASAEHFFVTTHALRLESWPDKLGRHGTLVAVPDRHTLLVLPIDGAGTVAATGALLRLAARRFENGPGSLSPHLYWRLPDGAWERQTSLDPAGSLKVVPTPAFAALVRRLGPGPR